MKVLRRNPRRELVVPEPRTVRNLLGDLALDREAHLVIRNGTLVPGDQRLDDDDTVEVRPDLWGLTRVSKCRVCRGPAMLDLPRHNANFCAGRAPDQDEPPPVTSAFGQRRPSRRESSHERDWKPAGARRSSGRPNDRPAITFGRTARTGRQMAHERAGRRAVA